MDDLDFSNALEGRRIVLVGAVTGIGRASAIRIVREGGRLAILDVLPDDHELVGDLLRDCYGTSVRYWSADLRDEARVINSMRAASDWLGGMDVLIHVAGIQAARGLAVEEVETGVWDDLMAINLRGAFITTKASVPLLRDHGAILLMGSGAGVFGPSGSLPYAASKGGLHGFAMTLERQLSEAGIRVNEVAPGSIDTPLFRREAGDALADEAGSAEGVAALIAFLASTDADHVRGTVRTR